MLSIAGQVVCIVGKDIADQLLSISMETRDLPGFRLDLSPRVWGLDIDPDTAFQPPLRVHTNIVCIKEAR